MMQIDTKYSFRKDTPYPKDIDTRSKCLQDYHYKLWNDKPLPNKDLFEIEKISKNGCLLFTGKNKEKNYSSDTIFQSFRNFKSMKKTTEGFADVIDKKIMETDTTIGGYILFPSNKIDNKQTINSTRGFKYKWLIGDRFDLTIECIRRFYKDGYRSKNNPMLETLNRYKEFFDLFIDFKGYVEFFYLEDLVEDYDKVKFFTDFKDFGLTSPFPKNKQEYFDYLTKMEKFIKKRNLRIDIHINIK
jgi:hypothetical protein